MNRKAIIPHGEGGIPHPIPSFSGNYSVHHAGPQRAKRGITFFIPALQIRLKIVTFAPASK